MPSASIRALLTLGLSAATLALLLLAPGCAFVKEDLLRAEESYQQARYERARAWLIDLEDDIPSQDVRTRVHYYYLRGMTEHRLRRRAEARHYLAVAREIAGEEQVGLDEEQHERMSRALAELTSFGDEEGGEGGSAGGEEGSDGEGEAEADDGGQP